MSINRIVIVGAGAMGCLFAAKLARGGADVTVVDVDAARIAVLARDGITLADDHGTACVPVHAALAGDVAGPAELVMLFTKSMHSRGAAASVAHLAGPSTIALTLQNGLGNAEALTGVFGPSQVAMGVTDFPADLTGPASVASHGAGRVWLGAYDAARPADVDAIAARFNACGLPAQCVPDANVPMWEKVAFNAALNSVATVTGLTVGGMDSPAGHAVITAIADEVIATARALNIAVDADGVHRKIAFALANHRQHQASMLQDRLAGRAPEIDAINGAVVAHARALGVPVPVTAALADLVRMVCAPSV
ncbi:ketopantoate reductase family protein [Novosphingobium sp.]|uniref:ketopantoate reductase family protein n=1 Tax=Novosphingobium sp. TaxID=1874826 RepID=UPI00333E676F